MLFKANLERTVDLLTETMQQQENNSTAISDLVLLLAQHHQSIMAPHKQPPKTEAQAVASGNFLMPDLFANKKKIGISKKRGNLSDENITVLAVKKVNSGHILAQTAKYL